MNLYLDTNVYLTFFHFTDEDLKELKKLIVLIKTGNIILYLPEQTLNEFDRNREVKIADSIKRIKESKFDNKYPRIAHSYSEYSKMQAAIKIFQQNKNKLLEQLQHDAENEALKADDVLNQLFEKAKFIETKDDILKLAVDRYNSGNPPGKGKSYGDAINWETLLQSVPANENLYFVSEDKDFYSVLNSNKFNDFLIKEWNEVNDSELIHYKKLTGFIKEHFPEIDITEESEKDLVISNLYHAYNYEEAKNAVRRLEKYDKFSIKQLNDITRNFSSNNQIYWIKNDGPIQRVRSKIIEANYDKLDPEILRDYKHTFEIE